MMGRLWQPRWFWFAAPLIGALVGVYYAVVGRPTTPMTSARADRLFGHALKTGQSRPDVEAWLTSRGIPLVSEFPERGISFDVLHRREDRPGNWWMDGRGNQTVAECAGLEVESVS